MAEDARLEREALDLEFASDQAAGESRFRRPASTESAETPAVDSTSV